MWTQEDQRKGNTNGSTFVPLYNGLKDSYVIDSNRLTICIKSAESIILAEEFPETY